MTGFFEYTERILWRYLYTISAGRYSCTQWSLGKGVLSTVVKAGTIESEDLWKMQSFYRKIWGRRKCPISFYFEISSDEY